MELQEGSKFLLGKEKFKIKITSIDNDVVWFVFDDKKDPYPGLNRDMSMPFPKEDFIAVASPISAHNIGGEI